MRETVYVHLDTISNSILTKGISAHDFYQSLSHIPDNIMLLNQEHDWGEFENHTAMRIIKGREQVEQYLSSAQRNEENTCWIDFSDLHLIKQLTPIEISELLYFGHMKYHLHSPFFYKLQNDYVFLTLGEEVNKLYCRQLEDFYRLLSQKIHEQLLERCKERKGWIKKPISITPPPLYVLKELKEVWQEGVVLYFGGVTWDEEQVHLPIYRVEDRLKNVDEIEYTKEMQVAELIYHRKEEEWTTQLILGEEL
ncbi:hypothetical protein [Catellicoccus marimammalium]|nr:hypothetical protein [Catellicoccus marimammalium]